MKLKKWLIGLLITFSALFLIFKFIAWPYLQGETKKISPQKVATYIENGMDLTVAYSSPFKKGRVIFGELVPYNEVWRTGANEPTTFTTKTPIKIIDKDLAAGTYALWTIPGKNSWSIIFNSEVPEWGVTLLSGGKETTRDPDLDVLQVEVPSNSLSAERENFTISFDHGNPVNLSLSWDETIVQVPIKR
ncbi:DUF2911 domain-containing protein [Maribacter algarum]|uniref:DUF2911 domain-containing protein n=1 Tax=Maribacter algarum (ex Zhang et al. 2020) TaxID=2578118 RepID=A0A5S3PGS0_9FLAO|nr:DUF2911 domain-containing protein [Maribacter algarum]TMM53305.1 DUF2911 domain-containing protein [Maribacter algarum]